MDSLEVGQVTQIEEHKQKECVYYRAPKVQRMTMQVNANNPDDMFELNLHIEMGWKKLVVVTDGVMSAVLLEKVVQS